MIRVWWRVTLDTAPALEVQNITVHRGALEVVRGVSLVAAPGHCIGLMGLNGAGKSSLLASIAGLLPSSSGSIAVAGRDVSRRPPWERCAAGLVLVPAGRQLFGELSVVDNLLVGAHLVRDKKARDADLESVFGRFPVLAVKRHQRARELSGGQQQMLAIGRGLMARPKALLLDEPSEGLAPRIVDEVFSAIADMKKEGATAIVLAEQNAGAMDVCESVVVLRDGVVVERHDTANVTISEISDQVFGGIDNG